MFIPSNKTIELTAQDVIQSTNDYDYEVVYNI